MKIMVVEDDPDIRELIGLYLEREGYAAVAAETGAMALELAARERPELIVLDVVLPDLSGMEVCRELRRHSDAPIVFVSCKRDNEDVIAGLDSGGDDYVIKPFDPLVLMARIRSQLRRMHELQPAAPGGGGKLWRDGRLAVHLQSCDVLVAGQPVQLFAKERQLLLFLVRHPNQVFSVEQLYEKLWGWDSESSERTVMVHISNLRRKIEADPANPQYVVTVRGFGYKFAGKAASG